MGGLIGQTVQVPLWVEMLIGGVANFLVISLIHPLDLLKVRTQLARHERSSFHMARSILRSEGLCAVYAGLSAAMLRQALSTSCRYGVYSVLYEQCVKERGRKPTVDERLCLGVYANTLGGFVSTPPEIALIRMMADGSRQPTVTFKYPRRYTNVMNALATIHREEGVRALWRGAVLMMTRNNMVGYSQLYGYEEIRRNWLKNVQGLDQHLIASVTASFFSSVLTLPIDTVKTIYQEDKNIAKQTDLVVNIIKNKGFLFLWQGFGPYHGRLSIHLFATYLLIDSFTDLFLLYAGDWRIFRNEKDRTYFGDKKKS